MNDYNGKHGNGYQPLPDLSGRTPKPPKSEDRGAEMKRYSIFGSADDVHAHIQDFGAWVKYADAQAEITRLRAENEAQREQIVELKETNAAIKRVTSGWRKDAERYRYLQESAMTREESICVCRESTYGWIGFVEMTEMDAAIDAAMKAEK